MPFILRQSRNHTDEKSYNMCLYEKYILNPKFKPNKKNGYNPPKCEDKRQQYIILKCGKCKECQEDKAKSWKTRIYWESFYSSGKSYYVTLTFDKNHFENLETRARETRAREKEIFKRAVRQFCDNWKYNTGERCTHFLIPEHGQEETERIHMHGLIWTQQPATMIGQCWKHGFVKCEEVKNIEACTNYIIKYITKIDKKHPDFIPRIYCSKGIGRQYTKDITKITKHKFKEENTNRRCTLQSGNIAKMPDYYKKKLWTDEQREWIWMHFYDKMEKHKNERTFKMSNNYDRTRYNRYIKDLRNQAKKLGY